MGIERNSFYGSLLCLPDPRIHSRNVSPRPRPKQKLLRLKCCFSCLQSKHRPGCKFWWGQRENYFLKSYHRRNHYPIQLCINFSLGYQFILNMLAWKSNMMIRFANRWHAQGQKLRLSHCALDVWGCAWVSSQCELQSFEIDSWTQGLPNYLSIYI